MREALDEEAHHGPDARGKPRLRAFRAVNYIIKLSGCRADGRDVSGEYDGGTNIELARASAEFFAYRATGGTIRICRPTNNGESLDTVEWVRS